MRKVLSWALTLAMVLTSFSVAFAATYSDTSGTACADAVGVLSELGVVNGYEDGTYKPSQVVTRAEASKLIVSALGLTSYASGSKSSFSDLSGYEWASGYIGYAQSLGVLKGDGNGKFRPGDTVTYNEMATIIARALGFTDVSLQGAWPANYVSKAKTLGIMDDITGGGGATGANRGDVAIMIYNALSLEIGYINNDNQWVTTALQSGKSDTMLVRLKASEYNGGEPFVVEYDKAKSKSATNLMKYVGAYVTAYQNKDNDIMAVKEVKSTFLKGKMSNGKFKADADDTEYTIQGADFKVVSGGALQMINDYTTGSGIVSSTAFAAAYPDKTVTLSAKISGTTIKEVYAIMSWSATSTDFFTADDANDISTDNSLFGADFVKDDNSKIDTTMFALNGATSLSAIQKDNVVQVYEYGGNGDIVRVDVGTQVVSGEVTSIKSDSDEYQTQYTISGTKYKFNNPYDSASITPTSGDEVKAFLTFGGKVYKFEKLSGSSNYAVVINRGNTTGLAGNGQIKLILADGTVGTYDVDEDEVKDAIYNEDTSTWANAITAGAIIKYNIAKDGKIDDITTCTAIEGPASATTISAKGYYNSCALTSDVSVFTFDQTWNSFTTKSDDYGVSTRAKVLDVDNVKAYYVLNKSGDIAAMLMNDANSNDDVFGVAISWEADNSDAGYAIQLLVNGTKTDVYSAKKPAYDTVNGDGGTSLYKVTFDAAKNVKLSTDLGNLGGPSSDDDAYNLVTASALSCAAISSNKVYSDTAKTNKIATLDSNVVVYVWNVSDKVYEKGSINDIKSSDYDGDRYFYATDNDNLDVYDIVLVKDNH